MRLALQIGGFQHWYIPSAIHRNTYSMECLIYFYAKLISVKLSNFIDTDLLPTLSLKPYKWPSNKALKYNVYSIEIYRRNKLQLRVLIIVCTEDQRKWCLVQLKGISFVHNGNIKNTSKKIHSPSQNPTIPRFSSFSAASRVRPLQRQSIPKSCPLFHPPQPFHWITHQKYTYISKNRC